MNGTFASTAIDLPPGRRTTMSGRPEPESLEMLDCTSKSTRSSRPAASTTLRSCVSPQTPRVLFDRSADASDSAVERSRSSDSAAVFSCWVSSPCCRLRWDLELA